MGVSIYLKQTASSIHPCNRLLLHAKTSQPCCQNLNPQRAMDLAQENGASSCMAALPSSGGIQSHPSQAVHLQRHHHSQVWLATFAHPLLSSLWSIEVWEMLPQLATRGLPLCSPPSGTSPIAIATIAGFIAVFYSLISPIAT